MALASARTAARLPTPSNRGQSVARSATGAVCQARSAGPRYVLWCPRGGIGRRARLRILWGNPCWFDSSRGHHLHLRRFAECGGSASYRFAGRRRVEGIWPAGDHRFVNDSARRGAEETKNMLGSLRFLAVQGPTVYCNPLDNVALFGARKPLSRPQACVSMTLPGTVKYAPGAPPSAPTANALKSRL